MFDCNYYKGILVQQHFNFKGAFAKLFEQEKPKRMLEIGTGRGGLTLFLKEMAAQIGMEDFQIRTYDTLDITTHKEIAKFGISVDKTNLFNHSYTKLEKPELIKDFIQQDGLTLVLCDGGNKKVELSEISDLIKVGDIIMCHDYVCDKKTFEEKFNERIWNWHEVCYADIEEACKRNNLKPFMQEVFEKVVWFCSKKHA